MKTEIPNANLPQGRISKRFEGIGQCFQSLVCVVCNGTDQKVDNVHEFTTATT